MIHKNCISIVGGTPLVALDRLGAKARICAKLEMMNPAGSVKDRLGVALISDAEQRGLIRSGMTLVEATGGNTGIGLAFAAAIKGYELVLTMPDTMSVERVALLKQLGARIVLTPGILMGPAVERAREIAATTKHAYLIDQFNNPANPRLHRETTGPEIWDASEGRVDAFVSAVGTGGTITGVGEFLKSKNPAVRIIAVEPEGSAVLSGGLAGQHAMPGIGVGFIPSVLNRSDAMHWAKVLAKSEGIIAGVSSGAALCATMRIANRLEWSDKRICVLLADTGERYITTALFG
jgi:cysteine synthase A